MNRKHYRFVPWGRCTWLLSELDNNGIGFGLCGKPEIGYVDLNKLMEIKGTAGLATERDMFFEVSKTFE